MVRRDFPEILPGLGVLGVLTRCWSLETVVAAGRTARERVARAALERSLRTLTTEWVSRLRKSHPRAVHSPWMAQSAYTVCAGVEEKPWNTPKSRSPKRVTGCRT